MKYVAKGFECAIPGVRRAAFKSDFTTKAGHFYLRKREGYDFKDGKLEKVSYTQTDGPSHYHAEGLGALFMAESEVLRARSLPASDECEWVERIDGRLATVEAAVIASKVAGKLGTGRKDDSDPMPARDYDSDDSGEFGSGGHDEYGHWKRACVGTYAFVREAFRRDVAVRLGDERCGIELGKTFLTFTDAGRFKPTAAHLEALYDQESLQRIELEDLANRAARAVAMAEELDAMADESDEDNEDNKEDGEDKEEDKEDDEVEDKERGRRTARTKRGRARTRMTRRMTR